MTETNSDWSGYRQDLSIIVEEPDSERLTEWSNDWSTEAIIDLLRSRSCREGEPWVGDDWRNEHGHTDCMAHALVVGRLEQLTEYNQNLKRACTNNVSNRLEDLRELPTAELSALANPATNEKEPPWGPESPYAPTLTKAELEMIRVLPRTGIFKASEAVRRVVPNYDTKKGAGGNYFTAVRGLYLRGVIRRVPRVSPAVYQMTELGQEWADFVEQVVDRGSR